MPRALLPLLAIALLAVPARAQPSAQAVVDAWRADWRRAAPETPVVEADERSQRTVEGPRRPITVETAGAVVYAPGQPPDRTVRRVRVNGREVAPAQSRRHGRRLERAFGPGGRLVTAPPPLPDGLMAAARATDLTATQLDDLDTWRVTLDTDRGSSQAWFTRSATAPRLLAVRTERQRGDDWLMREIRYARVDGLDLPVQVRAEVTARQRRRLRDYAVTLTVASDYTGHVVR